MRSALKFLAGAVAAGFLYFWATPVYDAFLARATTPLLRIDPRLRNVIAEREERKIRVRGFEDLELPNVVIPADELTYNVIIFGGLVAMRRGRLKRTAVVCLALVATHILAVAVTCEAAYATALGAWSDKHYSGNEQDFWTAIDYVYRLAGLFAVAFALWWLSLDPAEPTRRGADGRSRR